MRSVAASVFLAMVIGLAGLTAVMFAFVMLAGPGRCDDPSCLAVQTYQPGGTAEVSPALEPTGSPAAPPIVPLSSPEQSAAASPQASPAP